ncbi:Uncharacterized protein TCM_006025 [Theobroma cacao]|uniref:Uncharacterized protein n=1 Tax=Theobroma cacao TaxID=3641 RepID=A0A061DWU8_THECC|nr:Uncharacterized protein TCM_006025 [Theobroma cacao]
MFLERKATISNNGISQRTVKHTHKHIESIFDKNTKLCLLKAVGINIIKSKRKRDRVLSKVKEGRKSY